MPSQFLYVLRLRRTALLDCGPGPWERRVLQAHADYLARLHESGVVKLAGRTQENGTLTRGYVILDTADAAQAEAIMQADPAVAAGVMVADLHPFRVAVG